MLQCQKCGAQNSEESVHCCSCGEKLDKEIICSKCGCVRIPNDALFCPTCGKNLEEEFFNIANNVNTIEAYVEFQNKFKTGVYAHKVRIIINQLQQKIKEIKFEDNKKVISKVRCINRYLSLVYITISLFFLSGYYNGCLVIGAFILSCICSLTFGVLDRAEYRCYKDFDRLYELSPFSDIDVLSMSISIFCQVGLLAHIMISSDITVNNKIIIGCFLFCITNIIMIFRTSVINKRYYMYFGR